MGISLCIIGSRGYPTVYSGYETLVGRLAPGLVERGFAVTVYCHRHLFEQRPRSVNGVDLVYVPGLASRSLSQYSHSLASVSHAIRGGFDVALILNVANGVWTPILGRAGITTLVNVDGLEWERPKWKGLGARVFRLAADIAVRSATALVTDAQAMRARYLDRYGRDSHVITYGEEVLPVDATGQQETLRALGLACGGYCVILGRLVPDNNGLLLVKGFLNAKTDLKLVVIGDVPYRDEYAARLKEMAGGRVQFTGYIRDQKALRHIVSGARLYLHGHEFGGTNPSLLLAMSTLVPVVALDTEFSREVLPDVSGVYFFTKDEGSVAEAIERGVRGVVSVPALGERIESAYRWDSVVDSYASLARSYSR